MKKKIAMLLAAVMTISAPLTAFAGDPGDFTANNTKVRNAPAGTLVVDPSIYGQTNVTSLNNVPGVTVRDQGVDYIAAGKNIELDIGNGNYVRSGDSFAVNLNNGHYWYAQDTTSNSYLNINGWNATFNTSTATGTGTSQAVTNDRVTVYNEIGGTLYSTNATTLATNYNTTAPLYYQLVNPINLVAADAAGAAVTDAITAISDAEAEDYVADFPAADAAVKAVIDADVVTDAAIVTLDGHARTIAAYNTAETGSTATTLLTGITVANTVTPLKTLSAAAAALTATLDGTAFGTLKTAIADALAELDNVRTFATGADDAAVNAVRNDLNDALIALGAADIDTLVTDLDTDLGTVDTKLAAVLSLAAAATTSATATAGQDLVDALEDAYASAAKLEPAYDALNDVIAALAAADAVLAGLSLSTPGGATTIPAGTIIGRNVIAAITSGTGNISVNYRLAVANNSAGGALGTATITVNDNTTNLRATINGTINGTVVTNETNVAIRAVAYGSYAGGPSVSVQMPLVYKTLSKDSVKLTVNSQNAPFSGVKNDSEDLTDSIDVSGTKLSTSVVNATREQTTLGSININESAAGVIQNGWFALELNNGFRYVNNVVTAVASNANWANINFRGYSSDFRTAYFQVNVLNGSFANPQTIIVTGMEIKRDSDYYNYSSEEAKMTVRNLVQTENLVYYPVNTLGNAIDSTTVSSRVSGDTNITTQTITVATFKPYNLFFGIDNSTQGPVVNYAGRKNIETPMLRLAEGVADSWWSDRTTRFTLTDKDGNMLDGVKIAKVQVSNFTNVNYAGSTWTFSEDNQVGYNAYWSFYRSYLELKDMKQQSDSNLASMKIQFVINTAANFVGDVYVTLTGTGNYIDDYEDIVPVKIAEIKAPVKIDTTSTEVSVGFQTYKTADVTITEDAKGVLKAGTVFSLEIDEFANTTSNNTKDVYFNPITDKDVKMDEKTTLTFNKVTLGGNKLSFNISKPSTKADQVGKFTVSNLAVKIDRSVPYGGYDLIAGGSAIAETYSSAADLEKTASFPIKGVVFEQYVKVATYGSAKSVAKNVVMTPGSTKAVVDGKDSTIDPAPFINAEGRTMIPLRELTKLFDIPPTDVIWDPTTGTATVVINEKIVVFTNDSSTMLINGVPVAMVDENGIATKAVITEETNRMFLPLRQLGVAFGINVGWDGTNAIFNPTAEQTKTIAQ